MQRVRRAVRENTLSDPARVAEADYISALDVLGRTWVVEADGEIAAFAAAYRTGSIWALFVNPEHEGRGYGKALHSTMVNWLWSLGHSRLWLTTDPGTRAERFYISQGWQPCGIVSGVELRLELELTCEGGQPRSDPRTPDFGLNPGELRLVTVGPEWALRFSAERDRLFAALASAAVDIQHVGSTAIPGILAKPILDIAVAVRTFEDGYPLVPLLVAIGYEYRGENGIPRRHYFVHGSPRRTHHLHMLEQHSTEWERHIRFRDRLLESPAMAAQYSELKLASVSTSSGSRDRYQALKSSFIAEVQNPHAGPL